MYKEASKKIAEEIILGFKKKQAEDPKKQKVFFEFVKEKIRRSDPKAIKMFLKLIKDKTFKIDKFNNKVTYEELPENFQVRAWDGFLQTVTNKFMEYETKNKKTYRVDKLQDQVPFEQIPQKLKNFKDKAFEEFWKTLGTTNLDDEIEQEVEKVIKNLKKLK